MLSFSQLKLWQRCRQAHHYSYTLNLEKLVKPEAIALGSLIHEALQVKRSLPSTDLCEYYAGLTERDFNRVVGLVPTELDDLTKSYLSMRARGVRLLAAYEAYYNPDPLTYTATDIFLEYTLNGETIKGYADAIASDPNELTWIVEDKTTSRYNPTQYFMDEQGALYTAIFNLIQPTSVMGVIYSVMEFPNKFHRYERLITEAEQRSVMERFRYIAEDMDGAKVYRNVMFDCFNNCEFSALCQADILGQDVEYLVESLYRKRGHHG